MDASVIIPVKNGGNLLEEVLDRVSNQKTQYEYEIICVDSGSKDNSVDIVKKYNCELIQIEPQDFGHGKTRNLGASYGKGEFILFLTQDALPVDENWLENMLNAMKLEDDIAGGFGKHLPYSDCNILDKRDITAHFLGFGTENTIYYLEDQDRYEREEGYRHLLSYFSDNNSCVKRSVFEENPYPDVNFAEDQIWARHIIEQGYKKVYCPSAVVYHSHNYSIGSFFGRYYDEYKGLYDLHQYRIVKSKWHLFPAMFKHIHSDIRYVWTVESFSLKSKLKNSFYVIAREYCRYMGGWKGGLYHEFSPEKQKKWDEKYSQQYKQIKG